MIEIGYARKEGENVKHLLLKKIFIAFDLILPGALSAMLVAKCGLMWIGAVFILEFIQIMASNRIMQIKIQAYDWKKVLLTSAGIVIGGCLYRIECNPPELFTAVMVLSVVIHAVIYLSISNVIKK